ncbi:hypothetical protein CROQUDRAFT_675065 [Cronartium quercuum f. sp. fusiforme G11]|uniref:Uncharacterized protein n=1 Tax=Cronartium quercuum f. sp. fusiforme G11 TaxID=708437 RepID=A0A9P6N5F1_9BASI|nr:hypothetical protein CROQUDRAFT_675065 [Cronartium quercuum f. sp. fusiforme G11]
MATQMLTAIIDSVLPSKPQPVVPDSQLLKAMDLSFFGLILTLAALAFITSANPHVLALILVAICLWLSVRWFVAELARVNRINEPVRIASDLCVDDKQVQDKSTTQSDPSKTSNSTNQSRAKTE